MNTKGRNPLLPPEVYIPDGEAHVFGRRLYVYGSRDVHPDTWCSEEYCVASTEDMQNWKVSAKSFDSRDVPWADGSGRKDYPVVDFDTRNPTAFFATSPLCSQPRAGDNAPALLTTADTCAQEPGGPLPFLYAPDCMEKDGTFYLYFCMSDGTEGVARSDNPEGPFRAPVQLPCAGIDPAVFTDTDGRSYYYWGQFRSSGVELNDDMVSFDETKAVHHLLTEEAHGFHEGSSMRKRNGIYYYVYPCIYRNKKPTCLAYATSDAPLGPFTYRGIIIDNALCDPDSWNIHGSIQCFRGQWYVFYHRSTRNTQYNRRMCAERITFREDGTIEEVKMTSSGLGEPFALGEEIQGWRACEVTGGAYIDGETLVMPEGSSALFRYVGWTDLPARFTWEADGEGRLEPSLEESDKTRSALRLTAHGALRLRKILFEADS